MGFEDLRCDEKVKGMREKRKKQKRNEEGEEIESGGSCLTSDGSRSVAVESVL